MADELSKETIGRFDFLIKSFNTAIKNGMLYPSNHPVFMLSIKNLKQSLENWFRDEERLEMGMTQDNILLNSVYVKGRSDIFKEVAAFLHRRGVAALEIEKEVELTELADFINAVKHNPAVLREKGGVLGIMPAAPHLHVKILDYTDLLGSATEEVEERKWDVWPAICHIAEGAAGGELSESKLEILRGVLKNPDAAVSALKNVYKEATGRGEEEGMVKDMRKAFFKIVRHFGGDRKEGSETEKKLADILAGLGPGIVVKVLEEGEVDGENVDLAKEITKDLSDDVLGGFISALLSQEGGVSENLFKLFNKMVGKNRGKGVASSVIDNMMRKSFDDTSLSQLQLSLQELVKTQSGNDFMSEVYQITINTLVSGSAGAMITRRKLGPLVGEFKELMREDNIKREEVRLLLNLLWREEEPEEFEKISKKVEKIFPSIVKASDTASIRNILEFFKDKLSDDRKNRSGIGSCAEKIISLVNDSGTVEKLITAIPGAADAVIDDLVFVFSRMEAVSRYRLIDFFLSIKDISVKDRLLDIFSRVGQDIGPEISKRIENADYADMKDLLNLLGSIDAAAARGVVKKLFTSKDPKIKASALKGFDAGTKEDRGLIFGMFLKERDREIKTAAIEMLVSSNDTTTIEKLFGVVRFRIGMGKYLVPLIRACGDKRTASSVPFLVKILLAKPFFNTAASDNARSAAAVSLGLIATPEALDAVRKGSGMNREAVRNMCRMVLERSKNGAK